MCGDSSGFAPAAWAARGPRAAPAGRMGAMQLKRVGPFSLARLAAGLYGAIGLFAGAIFALAALVVAGLYNLLAGWLGGVELTLE